MHYTVLLGYVCLSAIGYFLAYTIFAWLKLIPDAWSGTMLVSNIFIGILGVGSYASLWVVNFFYRLDSEEYEFNIDPIAPLLIIYEAIIGIYDPEH